MRLTVLGCSGTYPGPDSPASCYLLEADGQVIGRIEEPHWFSMKRQLSIDLPNDVPVPLQTFLAFLVINSAFR